MRLELGTFPVEEVRFGSATRWDDGLLEVNRAELEELIRSDSRITSVSVELACPGESTRITHVRDVIDPRIKVSGPGTVYPGVCGRPVAVVGQGRTHRLSGVGVMEVSEVFHWRGAYGNDMLVDMSGPAAEIIPYGSLINVCVVLEVDASIHIESQNEALHRAALAVSDRLAATVADLDPPELEEFELKPVDPALPKVVYITCQNSPQHYAHSLTAWGTAIYGLTRQTPPWALHPNELLDGAICCRESWAMVNNPVVLGLYSRHGVDLAFAGCIAIRTRWSSQDEKDVTSTQCAKLAKLLGADGTIITNGGGNDFMEVIRTLQACELAGIKTVFVTGEEPAHTGGPPLLEPLPEARAIVVSGVGRRLPSDGIELPGVERVVGPDQIVADTNTRSAGLVSARAPVRGPRWGDRYGFALMSAFDW